MGINKSRNSLQCSTVSSKRWSARMKNSDIEVKGNTITRTTSISFNRYGCYGIGCLADIFTEAVDNSRKHQWGVRIHRIRGLHIGICQIPSAK